MNPAYNKKLKDFDFLGAFDAIPSIDYRKDSPLSIAMLDVLDEIHKREGEVKITKSEMNKINKMIRDSGYEVIRK